MSNSAQEFFNEVQATQMLWALHDKDSDGWVIVDSLQFEETEVMLLWSRESLAQALCTDEWQDYVPTQISIADWLEFWIEDLSEDNIAIGIDCAEEGEFAEMELSEFSQKIADIEKL